MFVTYTSQFNGMATIMLYIETMAFLANRRPEWYGPRPWSSYIATLSISGTFIVVEAGMFQLLLIWIFLDFCVQLQILMNARPKTMTVT